MNELNYVLTKKAVNKVESLRKKQLNRRKLIKTIKTIQANRKETNSKLKQAIGIKQWKPETKTCPISYEEIAPTNNAASLFRMPSEIGGKVIINSSELYTPGSLSSLQNRPEHQVYPGSWNSRQYIKSPLTRAGCFRHNGTSENLQRLKKIQEINNNNQSTLLRNPNSINYLRKNLISLVRKTMNKMNNFSNKMIYIRYSSLNLTNADKKKVTEDDIIYESNKRLKLSKKKDQVLRKLNIFKTQGGYFQVKTFYGSGKTRVSATLTLPSNYYAGGYSLKHFAPMNIIIQELRENIN